jgi:hypothetical protein
VKDFIPPSIERLSLTPYLCENLIPLTRLRDLSLSLPARGRFLTLGDLPLPPGLTSLRIQALTRAAEDAAKLFDLQADSALLHLRCLECLDVSASIPPVEALFTLRIPVSISQLTTLRRLRLACKVERTISIHEPLEPPAQRTRMVLPDLTALSRLQRVRVRAGALESGALPRGCKLCAEGLGSEP